MNIITGVIDPAKPEKSLPSPTKTRTGLFPAEKKPQQRPPDAKLISKVTADRLLARKPEPLDSNEPPPEEARPAKSFRKIPSSKINSKRWSDDPLSDDDLPAPDLRPPEASSPPATTAPADAPPPPPTVLPKDTAAPSVGRPTSRLSRPTTAPLQRLPQPSPFVDPSHAYSPAAGVPAAAGVAATGFPGYYGLYGQVAVAGAAGGGAPTIVYTNGPLPASTTSVILVPLTPAWGGGSAAGVRESQSCSGLRSVASDMSVDGQQAVMVCIDRNAHKEWFDENVPSLRLARIKRYKTVETFMHFMEKFAKRKIVRLGVFMLIRITDVEKLLAEVANKAPHCLRCFKGIYVYERCFAGGSTKSIKQIPENIKNHENLKMFSSVEQAFHRAKQDLELERRQSLAAVADL